MNTYAILGIIVTLCGLVWWIRRAGVTAERSKQAEARVEAIHDKKEKDDEVNDLAPADLDARLSRWLRDK